MTNSLRKILTMFLMFAAFAAVSYGNHRSVGPGVVAIDHLSPIGVLVAVGCVIVIIVINLASTKK